MVGRLRPFARIVGVLRCVPRAAFSQLRKSEALRMLSRASPRRHLGDIATYSARVIAPTGVQAITLPMYRQLFQFTWQAAEATAKGIVRRTVRLLRRSRRLIRRVLRHREKLSDPDPIVRGLAWRRVATFTIAIALLATWIGPDATSAIRVQLRKDSVARDSALRSRLKLVPRDAYARVNVFLEIPHRDTAARLRVQREIAVDARPLLSGGQLSIAMSESEECDSAWLALPWADPYPDYAEGRIASGATDNSWTTRQYYTGNIVVLTFYPLPLSRSDFGRFSGTLGTIGDPLRSANMHMSARLRITGRDSLAEWLISHSSATAPSTPYVNGNGQQVRPIPIFARLSVWLGSSLVLDTTTQFTKLVNGTPGIDVYEAVFHSGRGGWACEPSAGIPITRYNPDIRKLRHGRPSIVDFLKSVVRAAWSLLKHDESGDQQ